MTPYTPRNQLEMASLFSHINTITIRALRHVPPAPKQLANFTAAFLAPYANIWYFLWIHSDVCSGRRIVGLYGCKAVKLYKCSGGVVRGKAASNVYVCTLSERPN